ALSQAAQDTRADVWVMAPMVTDVDDATWFVGRARAAGLSRPGVVVEVPAAALTAGNVLRVAAFACVSSEDLGQYALAADRQVEALSAWRDPWHPAVLRLVELVGAAGSLSGKPVSVCGPAAADPLLACVLVGLGVTSLSMPPSGLARVRAGLARHTFGDCLAFTDLALGASTAAEARDRVGSLASS
ncbi:MAG TPA: putative PEP-binding protein, partial [Cryptosporangiaceae bacterium]|nr:putative PEP-binding protein [Cryptosporangiaceae bacterium]